MPPHSGRLALDEIADVPTNKRATGIEPALKAWKAFVQPQHFARAYRTIVPSHKPTKLRPVRIRALLFLLALTVGDYLLWKWSIANGHDVLSLLAGCTLVPLMAISAYRFVLACAGLLSYAARRSSTSARAKRASRKVALAQRASHGPVAESDPSSRRLAA